MTQRAPVGLHHPGRVSASALTLTAVCIVAALVVVAHAFHVSVRDVLNLLLHSL